LGTTNISFYNNGLRVTATENDANNALSFKTYTSYQQKKHLINIDLYEKKSPKM